MTYRHIIGYLAPEIPALSATFVYNEILLLENFGYRVIPISVHQPSFAAKEKNLEDVRHRTDYLYQTSFRSILTDNLRMLARRPVSYFKTWVTAVSDAWQMGLCNRIGLGLMYRCFVSSRVARILLQEGCKHLHVHFAHIPTDIAMYASKLSATPFSFTAHANDLFERGWLLEKKVMRSTFTVTISEYNRQFLIGKGAQGDKIHVIRCGVDIKEFGIYKDRTANPTPKIGVLGRLVEKKGIDDLIDACSLLKEQNVKFELDIAGDGPLKSQLHAQVIDKKLSEQVNFKGAVSHEQVSHWLHSLDIFVLPCKKDRSGDIDGIPVVLMEAMLAGVPVVSCLISGIPELVENGLSGLLVKPENPPQIAEAISKILSDKILYGDLRKNAIVKVQSEFELTKNVAQLHSLFKRKSYEFK
jgi:glycosyltransferase involved in cell wall biosynthesis